MAAPSSTESAEPAKPALEGVEERAVTSWAAAAEPEAAAALIGGGVPANLALLLARRGVLDPDAAHAFLQPHHEQLHDPFRLHGMEAAVERLSRARSEGEGVAIVGDYDVDGVTATALLVAIFRACGIRPEAILPHRLQEGYGFQPIHVERAIERGCSLVVTADCGTTSTAAVEAAAEKGLDVIVTDHHLPGEPLPEGTLLINPKQEGCDYPFDELSGAGLAFKLGLALARRMEKDLPLEALLRIASLGTIADLVPLVGENRVIAALGLRAMKQLRSPGLLALIREARIALPVTAVDVGFRIGPRINAAGRLGSADSALELLLTRDRRRSGELARQLDRWNRERQDEERKVVDEAREELLGRGELANLLIAWNPAWHPGVIGIAAGKLAKELLRPVILLNAGPETATGSGRSIGEIDLHGLVAPLAGELERFGGHSKALGLTVASSNLERLRERLEEGAAGLSEEHFRRRYEYEMVVGPEEVSEELLRGLEALEPHGEGNPRPLLKVGPARLDGGPRFFGRDHLGGRLRAAAGATVDFVGWGWQKRIEDLEGSFELLAYLERDNYRQGPVLRLLDSKPVT